MENFAAIDFETANEQRTSVCSVGVVIVRDGEIVDHYYSLIRPEPEYYSYWNTRVHGLTLADTAEAPVFPVVWQEIAPLIDCLLYTSSRRTPSSPVSAMSMKPPGKSSVPLAGSLARRHTNSSFCSFIIKATVAADGLK